MWKLAFVASHTKICLEKSKRYAAKIFIGQKRTVTDCKTMTINRVLNDPYLSQWT